MPLNNENWMEYRTNRHPKCPHCDEPCEIGKNEWYQLYDINEVDHEVTCPHCDKEFTVHTQCDFRFSTDDQPSDEDA